MDKKGQIGLGLILVVFMTILVGVILFQAIAQEVGGATSTTTVVETSLGTATNGTAIYLTDYRALSDVVIINGTTAGGVVGSGNYTVTNNVVDPTTGGLAVSILPAASEGYYSQTWYLNATAQPTTYIAESGGRAVAGLIVIFFALAIAVVALYPTLANKFS